MNSTTVLSLGQLMQSAFQLIALMQFTAYMWPRQATVNDRDSFDFIIVGAGTAGSVIANRLTENPAVNVLLIEAGGDPPLESDLPGALLFLQKSRYDWNFTSEDTYIADQCHRKPYFEMSQGKMLGGTSSLNYLQYARGYPVDYDSWAEITNDDTWKWNNVLPAFIKSERLEVPEILNSDAKKYHGTDGYLGITQENSSDITDYLNCFKEVGHKIVTDFNPDSPLGYSKFLVTIATGQRQSGASAFLTPAKDRSNLHVLKDTTVTKIIIENKTAKGVEALTSNGKTIIINAKKEVIISAGVFNTPKLLMLSGIGPKEHLKSKGIDVVSDLPVGENLQDHVGVVVLHKLKSQESSTDPINPHEFPSISFKGFVAIDRKQQYPDYEINNFIARDNVVLQFCSLGYPFTQEICDTVYKQSDSKMAIFNQIINLSPKSRGKVLLRSSNPADPPIINTSQFSDLQDLENLVSFIDDLTPILNTTYYKKIDAELMDPIPGCCKEFVRGTKDYLRCYAKCLSYSMNHFTSTCSMGTVVDGRLKVLGVKGLRVADASVMPNIPRANPAATVFMIGEKMADFVKNEYGI
ncbi:ecdysone oxidase-like [Anticarsia gemmatalis]|uniref:ecdysone oxidase-like n=1 Tax=Anticarsia gemmatalis TaxID=129554 RepID=UPI003F7643F8